MHPMFEWRPDALRVNGPIGGYPARVWIFCPAGLEGPVGEGVTRETRARPAPPREYSASILVTTSSTRG